MRSLKVEDDLLDDLKVLKGILEQANMTGTIRRIMKLAGHDEKFFKRIKGLKQRRTAD